MKALIKRWLGITALEDKLDQIHNQTVAALFDEFDPRRKEVSDYIGEKHRQRLIAEDKARRHTLGEL